MGSEMCIRDSIDTQVRMDAFGEIQRLLIEDAVIIPDYERGRVFVADKRLQDIGRRAIGPDPDFSRVWLTETDQPTEQTPDQTPDQSTQGAAN